MQLVTAIRRTRTRQRLARLPLLRGVLLLSAALPARVCRASGGFERCDARAGRIRHNSSISNTRQQGDGHVVNASWLNVTNSSDGVAAGGRAVVVSTGEADIKAHPTDVSLSGEGRRPHIEYDGYEDARVIVRPGGQVFLLANHEDCEGRRRLCLIRLKGDALRGDALEQDGTWVLRVDDGGPDGLELEDNEKNWSPFVVDGVLHLSYSLQPHVVLRCAWSGGACRTAYNSSSDFLNAWDTYGQGLRGGTPYVQLDEHTMLSAMHVKDTEHTPALYSTILYVIDARPPFRILSLSPRLCLSERKLELASSARCALQYVVGLALGGDYLLLSYGDFDRRMKVASLPLDAALALARTHQLGADGDESVTECATGTASEAAWGATDEPGG